MFARNVGPPTRSGVGYVCLACRHERVLSARQTRPQVRRWNSELHKSSSATDDADDWLLPLNDLSEEFGDKKERSVKKEATIGSGNDQSMEELRSSLNKHINVDGNGQRQGAAGKARRTEHTRATTSAATRRSRVNKPTGSKPRGLSHLIDSLKLESHGENLRFTPGEDDLPMRNWSGNRSAAAQAPRKPISQNTARTSTASGSSGNKALLEMLGPDIEKELGELAAEDSEAQYEEWREKSAAVSVPEPEAKFKEPVAFPDFASKDPTSAPAPAPGFFSSAFKYMKEKVGMSTPVRLAKVEPESKSPENNTEGVMKGTAKEAYGADSMLDSPKLTRKAAPQKSPVEMWEESSKRSPWGTNPSARGPPDSRVASYEDIASADRVSIKKPISTRISSRPFGSEPNIDEPTIDDLRDQISKSFSKANDGSSIGNEAALKHEPAAAAQPLSEETILDESSAAHSRLSKLHAERSNTAADIANDAHDAERDVQASIRKITAAPSLDDPALDWAIKAEAARALKGQSRVTRKSRLKRPILSPPEATDSAAAAVGGMSLGAAMGAGPKPTEAADTKRRVGRPRKELATIDHDSDVGGQVASQPAEVPALPEKTEESKTTSADEEFRTSNPSQLHITPLNIPQPPVPYLQYGLDRVLFNPGVYQLQDEASRVYNFDPYLQNIMSNAEFDFDSLKEYKTSSKDEALAVIAKEHGNKYIGSTSSMTSALGHFHYLLSNWRPLNYGMLSQDFLPTTKALPEQLTQINRAPSAIFLRWKNGTYAIDADKEHDSANVLMLLGKSMELLLTLPKDEFERYRKSDPREVTQEQRTSPESYQYTTMRDFLMRSQLDAYDPRLPGNGTFDLKTRAVVSVRMAADDHEPMTGYELNTQQGKWNSYEKEYYDMMRSTMLKYMLQARMGRMNGIFIAYHNVDRMFGFQYVPIADMDRALHGQTDPCLGDQEFRASLDIMNEVFNAATKKFPEQSLRIHFETKEEEQGGMPAALHVFAEPMSEEECDTIQDSQKAKIAEWERTVMGKTDTAVEDVEKESQTANISAEEVTSTDFSNEVVQDKKVVTFEEDASDDAVVAASEEDATNYARSLLSSEKDSEAAQSATDNSTSHADPKFLNKLAASSTEEIKPLFYATIIAQSHVDGNVVDRPRDLKPSQEWKIDYILKEYDIGRHQWATYEDLKARRKHAYVKEEDEEGVEKRADGYIAALRGMSERGRALRAAKDKREDGLPVVRVEELDLERLEKVESVEDYMRILSRPKEKGSREMFG